MEADQGRPIRSMSRRLLPLPRKRASGVAHNDVDEPSEPFEFGSSPLDQRRPPLPPMPQPHAQHHGARSHPIGIPTSNTEKPTSSSSSTSNDDKVELFDIFGARHQLERALSAQEATEPRGKVKSKEERGEGNEKMAKGKDATSAEHRRLAEDKSRAKNWKRWGPYLSERMWGTVREDYSSDGDCWNYLPHENARSKAYRWGEDGLLGITDRQCRLCFALCLWNEKDPILKERLYGLTGPEGNHGEDVKEEYFYLRSTPTHSYMKALYKYPIAAYPYELLKRENSTRSRHDCEYELVDTGVFNNSEYWDLQVEYAKDSPNSMCIKITASNRSNHAAPLHILPTLWFRNTWAFASEHEDSPDLKEIRPDPSNRAAVVTEAGSLGRYVMECDAFESDTHIKGKPEWIFTENNTNQERLYHVKNASTCVKDGFHEYVIKGKESAIDRSKGSKCAAHISLFVPAKSAAVVRLRLFDEAERSPGPSFDTNFDKIVEMRIREHEEFYNAVIPTELVAAEREVCVQAFAGLLWSKQFFHYIIRDWLEGDPGMPKPPESRQRGRNADWGHLFNRDIISMPDKWEYPWYAVWDLAFHMVTMAEVDIEFAKEQLLLVLREWYMHPNGCLPAYEFAFDDVNPPVHAWACYRVYKLCGDTSFLQSVFQKLIINFTWWVNRKDPYGNNLFSGGFLGLDNIGVFDRSKPMPTGGELHQADGTSWMAFYCLYMLKIAVELALKVDPVYEDMASKFFEHFVLISDAMNALTEGKQGLWDSKDGFFYDSLKIDGHNIPLKVRSLVGLTPLFATGTLPDSTLKKLKGFNKRTEWFLQHRKDLSHQISLLDRQCDEDMTDSARLYLLSIPNKERIESMLTYMYDDSEFMSDFGIRSLSKFHKDNPYVFRADGHEHRVDYVPGESNSALFGGNSNWRGPVWFPMNYLLIEAMERLDHFYGESLSIEFPPKSGSSVTPYHVSVVLCARLTQLFLPNESGRRPCHGSNSLYATDDAWKDLVLFYEHFDPETGRGLGASHQTGWTSLVVNCMFKLARFREIRHQLPPDAFVNRSYTEFHEEDWINVDADPSLAILQKKGGFATIKDMMRYYFDEMPWKYRSLLLIHAIRSHVTADEK